MKYFLISLVLGIWKIFVIERIAAIDNDNIKHRGFIIDPIPILSESSVFVFVTLLKLSIAKFTGSHGLW